MPRPSNLEVNGEPAMVTAPNTPRSHHARKGRRRGRRPGTTTTRTATAGLMNATGTPNARLNADLTRGLTLGINTLSTINWTKAGITPQQMYQHFVGCFAALSAL